MWSVGSSLQEFYLATNFVAWCSGSNLRASARVESLEAGCEQLAVWLTQASGRQRVKVWLSGHLCRPFMLDGLPRAATKDEQVAIIQALAQQTLDTGEDCMTWLDGSSPSRSTVAIGLARSTMDLIQAACSGHRICAIAPWWSDAMGSEGGVKQGDKLLLALQDTESITLLGAERDRLRFGYSLSPLDLNADGVQAVSRALVGTAFEEMSPSWLQLLGRGPETAAGPARTRGALQALARGA